MIKEFKEFIARGNVVDMAVGIIMGAAFGAIVQSLVKDVIMPPIGVLLGGVDFSNSFLLIGSAKATTPPPYASLAEAQKAGAVTLNYGVFLNTIITFLIVSFAVFLLVRAINKIRKPQAAPPPARVCPFCCSELALKATRCPHCTSEVGQPAA